MRLITERHYYGPRDELRQKVLLWKQNRQNEQLKVQEREVNKEAEKGNK